MGHRALVAVERRPGEFDCYRTEIVPADLAEGAAATVDGVPPVVTGASVSRVLATVDRRADEALVVRTLAGTERFLVRWLGVPTAGADGAGPTALVPIPGDTDAAAIERLDCGLRTAKGVLGDAVDAGLCPRWLAVGYLVAFLARHPDAPGEPLWLPTGSRDPERGRW